MANNLIQIKRTSVSGRAANTLTLPNAGTLALNMPDQILYSTDGSTVFEIGANLDIQNVRTAIYVGANVDILTSGLFLGNTTVNLNINSTSLSIANSTSNTHISVPTTTAYSATNYFLHANGSWVQVTGGSGSVRVYQSYTATGGQTTFTVSGGYTIGQIEVYENGVHLANTEYTQDGSTVVLGTGALVGAIIEVSGWINMGSFSPVASGSNTQVQFNDSTSFGGSTGFTFDKATNSAVIANTLTIGGCVINNTHYASGANVTLGTATLRIGTTTVNLTANSSTVLISNSTVSAFIGDVSGVFQVQVTRGANVANLSSSSLAIGTSFVNATTFTTGGILANTIGIYPTSNTVGQLFGNTLARWEITANAVTVSGITTLAGQTANSIGFYPLSNTSGQLLGNTISRFDISVGSLDVAGAISTVNIQVNSVTANYTLASTDSGKVISVANTTSANVIVLAGLPIGFRCQVLQANTGAVTISNTGQTGVLLFSRTGGFVTTAKWGSASIFQPSANVYVIDGSV